MAQSVKSVLTETEATADRAVRGLVQQLNVMWEKGDAEGYAQLFTEDADYIVFDGSHLKGRQAIVEAHRPLFEKFLKGSRLVSQGLTLQPLSPEIMLVHTQGAVLMRHQKKMSRRRISVQTLVAKKREEGWRFVAFQNTRYRPFNQTLFGKLLLLLAPKGSTR